MSPPEGQTGPAPLPYGLDDVPALRHQLLYALQLVAFALGIVLVTTALIGPAIGLSRRETVDFGCRVLVVTGVATLLQSYWGHGYPIVEGPAALFWALYLFAFANAPAGGAVLSDIEGAMLVAGVVVALFAASGLTRDSAKLFTPILAGTTLMLVSLSFAADSAARFAGVSAQHPQGDLAFLAAVVGVVVLGAAITVLGRGRLRTLPILLTAVVAYGAAALLGRVDYSIVREAPLFAAPRPLAWGLPTFRLDLAVTFAIVALLATVNTIAAVEAGASLYGHHADDLGRHRRGILFNGVAQVLAGLGAAAGTTSLASSVVVLSLAQAGARATMVLAASILIALGFFPVFSSLLATVPAPIVNGLFFLIAANLFSLGLDQLARGPLDGRARTILGVSILAGLAVSYAPPALFQSIPYGGSLLFSNPIVVGTGTAFLGEHVIFGTWTRKLASRL